MELSISSVTLWIYMKIITEGRKNFSKMSKSEWKKWLCLKLILLCVILAQGIRDLFWLPVEQYKKDGRFVRGIQRGATSFSTSTAMAMLELTNRAVQSVQVNSHLRKIQCTARMISSYCKFKAEIFLWN